MSRFVTPFVLGYHGCEREVGLAAVESRLSLIEGREDYHWLGHGIYFWESDPGRALEWAREKAQRGQLKDPFVVGAIIDLGNCLDLQLRENADLFQKSYENFSVLRASAGLLMPKNKRAKGDLRDDKVLRYLDCAIINNLHELFPGRFDTVRGVFVEGEPIYPGSGLHDRTHSEIAVCNPTNIKGVFIPPAQQQS